MADDGKPGAGDDCLAVLFLVGLLVFFITVVRPHDIDSIRFEGIDPETEKLVRSGGEPGEQLLDLERQLQKLTKKLSEEVTTVRRNYHLQFEQAQRAADADISIEPTRQLERERAEIARALLALDAFEQECRDALTMVASSCRGLRRLIMCTNLIGADEATRIVENAKIAERTASSLLESKLGSPSAIDEAAVESKLRELTK